MELLSLDNILRTFRFYIKDISLLRLYSALLEDSSQQKDVLLSDDNKIDATNIQFWFELFVSFFLYLYVSL